MQCVICHNTQPAKKTCKECEGRGYVDTFPWAERARDEIIPGLWVGGHVYQPARGWPQSAYIGSDEFDLVVSLYREPGDPRFLPPARTRHIEFLGMGDQPMDVYFHEIVDGLAGIVAKHVAAEEDVLVRCQAGINRSAMVAAIAMTKLGWNPTNAISEIRHKRTPYALANESFYDFVMKHEAVLHR